MSNIVLNANRLSYLKPNINPLNYSVVNFPNGYRHSMNVRSREPIVGTYGSRYTFDVPRGGLLSGITLEFTVSSEGDNTEVEDRLGNHLFKNVELRTRDGSKCISRVIGELQDIRMDEMVSNKFESVVEPDVTFSGNSVTCYCPLFMFCFEDIAKYFDTEFVEDLELIVDIADNKEEMGLPTDISYINCEIICNYLFMETVTGPKDVLAYNVFQEKDYAVTGTSDVRDLDVEKMVFATHVGLFKNRQILSIDRFKITSSNYDIADTTFRLNLCNMNDYRVLNGNQMLTYYWSMFNDRNNNSCFTNFKEVPNTTMTLYYRELSGYTRRCFHEYWYVLRIDKQGRIFISV